VKKWNVQIETPSGWQWAGVEPMAGAVWGRKAAERVSRRLALDPEWRARGRMRVRPVPVEVTP
jgi:hypothetical protein